MLEDNASYAWERSKKQDLCEGPEDHFVVVGKCADCEREVEARDLVIIAGKGYCEDCAREMGHERCYWCGKWDPIGSFIETDSGFYHYGCLEEENDKRG